MNSNDNPISAADLAAFVLGELDAEQARVVERQAARDSGTARMIEQFRRVIGTLKDGPLESPPRLSIERAVSLFRAPEAPMAAALGWITAGTRRVLDLIFDSQAQGAIAGFRGDTESRHITFASGEVEVDVLVESEPAKVVMRGQVSGTEAKEVVATAIGTHEVFAMGRIDGEGGFVLESKSRECDLHIRTSTGVLTLRGIGEHRGTRVP
ncbi:MAG: hypothetical protein JSR77_15765 [Planctomycetes bacterium]|nr:hypothetical protein [Planctomycetota bacterium]